MYQVPTTQDIQDAIIQHTYGLEFLIEAMRELLPSGTHGTAEILEAMAHSLRVSAGIDADDQPIDIAA